MPDTNKFVNQTGLLYFYNRLKTLFAAKTTVDELDARVDDLVAEGGEPNTIESITVNGTAVTPTAQKVVALSIPIATSELTNDGDGSSNFATEDYVDTNGGKIDSIKVNNAVQTITNKSVNIEMPKVAATETSGSISDVSIKTHDDKGLTVTPDTTNTQYVRMVFTDNSAVHYDLATKAYTDATFRTEAQVQTAIDESLADITGIDFQVVSELPATGVKGVIYLLTNTGTGHNSYDEYIWITGTPGHYEKIGATDVDLSGYWSKTELVALTTAEIDTIINS